VNRQGKEAFSAEQLNQIREAIRKKYTEVSISAEGKFGYTTGKEGAIALSYPAEILENLSSELLNSFCGVGNPFLLSPINAGDTVLDIGSGAGFDLLVANYYAGPEGRVCGIDLTQEMVQRARENIGKAGIDTIEITYVLSEKIPYDNETFDVVTSNGVINLSPSKPCFFRKFIVF
jgi:2-polyprenyl-3-methyl-5-hydroxy-6-metoxy-1,4-benzoquinol methylase